MKISTGYNSSFPDQVVPDEEKATIEYGLLELSSKNGSHSEVVLRIDSI